MPGTINSVINPTWVMKKIGQRLVNNWKFTNNVLRDLDQQYQQNGAKMGFTVDRKSTRLNSSHMSISYAVFCLKKKKKKKNKVHLQQCHLIPHTHDRLFDVTARHILRHPAVALEL